MNGEWTDQSRPPDDPVRSAANIELMRSQLHALANTLAGMQSAVELLDPQTSEVAAAIGRATNEAHAELRSLRNLLRGSHSQSECFDVRTEMERVLEWLRRTLPTGISIDLQCPVDTLANAPIHDFQVAVAELLLNWAAAKPAGDLAISVTRKADSVRVKIGSKHLDWPAI